MCGICGVSGKAGAEALETVRRMNSRLRHRGPDATGEFHQEPTALAMSRLAVLDLETGSQPVESEDGRYVAVFNGEIYNFRELRSELVEAGYRFRSSGDSEVIAQGFAAWGHELPRRLLGMFAFCVFDRRRRSLFLARDRFGEKPLFYAASGDGTFAFSSELASLLECRAVSRRADPRALAAYLRLGFVPEPYSGFRDVRSLPPGHTLVWDGHEAQLQRYWRLDYEPEPALAEPEAAAAAVRDALRAAVKRQSISDVPLGAFLSGGIDSSAVAAMLQQVSSQRVQTFTVRFEEQTYDESAIARETAAHLGTEHHELVVPNVAFDEELFWRIVDHVGSPFYDSSAIPTYLLSREVRKHVTVALTGDGGDEMFAGYPVFDWGMHVRRLARLPEPVREGLAAGARYASGRWRGPGSQRLRQARRAFAAASSAHEGSIFLEVHSLFDAAERERLVRAPQLRSQDAELAAELAAMPPSAARWSPLRRFMHYRVRHNLVRDMLVKVDRMSMACSLELRAPMLDLEVADVARRLPDSALRAGGEGKLALREAIRPLVPERVLSHPKRGFSLPLHMYRNDAYRHLAAELLRSPWIAEHVARDELERIQAEGLTASASTARSSVYRSSHQLWSLMMLAGWARRFEVV